MIDVDTVADRVAAPFSSPIPRKYHLAPSLRERAFWRTRGASCTARQRKQHAKSYGKRLAVYGLCCWLTSGS